MTIDEETFHGRCKPHVFIPTKAKLIYCMIPVLTVLVCQAIYVGKVGNQLQQYNSAPEIVKWLVAAAKLEIYLFLPTTKAWLDKKL